MDGIGSAAADQEDFVSMGMNITIKNNQNIENAYGVPGHRVHGRGASAAQSEFVSTI
jgi:hypothetical protein